MSAEGNRCTTSVGPGEKHLPDGRHSLGGEATTQKQYLRSPLSLKTTQDLKHLNKNKLTGRSGAGRKAKGRKPGLMHYFTVPTKSPLSFFFLFGLFQFWGFFVIFFSLINMQFDFPYLT